MHSKQHFLLFQDPCNELVEIGRKPVRFPAPPCHGSCLLYIAMPAGDDLMPVCEGTFRQLVASACLEKASKHLKGNHQQQNKGYSQTLSP